MATGVVDSVASDSVRNALPKVTWADVVRNSPIKSPTTAPLIAAATGRVLSKSQGQDSTKSSKLVLSSLSQNNPVNRI